MTYSNSIALRTSYAPIIDEAVAAKAKTTMLVASAQDAVQFINASTVNIMSIVTADAGDYNRNTGFSEKSSTVTWTAYTLPYERSFKALIDKKDAEQNGVYSADVVMSDFVNKHLIPELDKTRLAKISATAMAVASDANVEYGYTPAAATFLTKIVDGLERVKTAYQVDEGINIFINESYAKTLYASTEVTKTRDVVSGLTMLDTRIKSINGNPITYVPDSYMKSAYTLNDSGITASASAKNVVACMAAPGVVKGIHNVTESGIMDAMPIASGMYAFYRGNHGAIITTNDTVGTYAILSSAKA